DIFLDQQLQIRRGQPKNSVWNVFVEHDGEYEVSLRRWPVEADTAIADSLPEYKAVDGIYVPGTALAITQARLKIARIETSKAVAAGDKEARFTVSLRRGRAQLQTWFYDSTGQELCGAYYVYVRANK
ncbi:MAG: arylsulfatase, partial [Verrucomicrobiota bacterium]